MYDDLRVLVDRRQSVSARTRRGKCVTQYFRASCRDDGASFPQASGKTAGTCRGQRNAKLGRRRRRRSLVLDFAVKRAANVVSVVVEFAVFEESFYVDRRLQP